MPVCSQDIFESAQRVSAIGSHEADYRCAISRLYYAGYHACNDFHNNLTTPGVSKQDVGVHENLVNQLNNPTVPNTEPNHQQSIELAQYLKKSLFNRRLADYKLDQPVTKKNVAIVQSQIELIFSEI